jgi:hypothetical protein
MSTSDNFDRQFRRTALGMRRRPAPRSWDRIEHRLDRRDRSRGFLTGFRPWMIAAVLILVAGLGVIAGFPPEPDPLAQRAERMEELSDPVITPGTQPRIPDYRPVEDGRRDGYLMSPSEGTSRLTVAPKYRL